MDAPQASSPPAPQPTLTDILIRFVRAGWTLKIEPPPHAIGTTGRIWFYAPVIGDRQPSPPLVEALDVLVPSASVPALSELANLLLPPPPSFSPPAPDTPPKS